MGALWSSLVVISHLNTGMCKEKRPRNHIRDITSEGSVQKHNVVNPLLPSVSISFLEGLQPDVAFLFCNDRAQLPIKVMVRPEETTIEEVGFFKASKMARSIVPDAVHTSKLGGRLKFLYINSLDERQYMAHPFNKEQNIAHEVSAAGEETFKFLVNSENCGCMREPAAGDKLHVGTFALLSGYKPRPDSASQTIAVYSYMNAKNSSGRYMRNKSRVELVLHPKPALCLIPSRQTNRAFGPGGSGFNCGAIYQINATYGAHAEMYPDVKIKSLETTFMLREKDDLEKYVPVEADSLNSKHGFLSDNSDDLVTFYADSPADRNDVMLRAVYHGPNVEGLVSQELRNDEKIQYMFRRAMFKNGTGVASFSWYYVRNRALPTEKIKHLESALAYGRFKTLISDVYGSETSMTVSCETAYSGDIPVNLNIETTTEHA